MTSQPSGDSHESFSYFPPIDQPRIKGLLELHSRHSFVENHLSNMPAARITKEVGVKKKNPTIRGLTVYRKTPLALVSFFFFFSFEHVHCSKFKSAPPKQILQCIHYTT